MKYCEKDGEDIIISSLDINQTRYMQQQAYGPSHHAAPLLAIPPVVPPRANEIYHLAVVATNRETFETGLMNLTVNVTATSLGATAKYNIKLKIDNLNIEDVFDPHRLKNLRSLFMDRFWPQSSSDLHLSNIGMSKI